MSRNQSSTDKDGAVEIGEDALDEASVSGGVYSFSRPAESLDTSMPPEHMDSLAKVTADLKPDPSIGLLSEPVKKL